MKLQRLKFANSHLESLKLREVKNLKFVNDATVESLWRAILETPKEGIIRTRIDQTGVGVRALRATERFTAIWRVVKAQL